MATTEELLAQLENNPEMYASDESQELVIDAETRTINIPASETLFGVKGDKNIERKYFRCPRIVGDNVDLSTHLIYIAYVYTESNSGSIFPTIGIQPYHCDDVEVDGDDITFSWKLSDHVFQSAGFIAFKMYAKEKEDSPYTVFNTAPAIGTVLYTIGDGEESVVSEYPDIINQLLAEMESVQEIATPEAMQRYVDAYLEENPVEGGMTDEQIAELGGKLDANQGVENAGKTMVVGDDGTITPKGIEIGGTNEKNYAASVNELLKVGTDKYVSEYPSLMFIPSTTGILSVGSDNLIGAAYSGKVNALLEPTLIYTEIQNGYSLDWNEDYTGIKNWQNTRFGFSVNLVSGKTYTLSLKTNKKSTVYLHGVNGDERGSGSLIATISSVNGTGEITFIVSSDYNRLRVACTDIPIEITEIVLVEGEEQGIYNSRPKQEYSVTIGVPLYLFNVKDVICDGSGDYYASPYAVTNINGIYTDGKAKTYATDKCYVNMGDSIWTFGSSTGGIGNLSDYMSELCGGTWVNIATGGTTMANRPGEHAGEYDALDFHAIADCIYSGDFSSAKNSGLTTNLDANVDSIVWDDVDVITIAYGTNDLAFNGTLDNSENLYDKNTVCGALRYGIEKISEKYPKIKYMVIGILYRYADGIDVKQIIEWNEGIKRACEYVGAEYIPMDCGINKGNRRTYLYDGTHPNEQGKIAIAKTVAKRIINI